MWQRNLCCAQAASDCHDCVISAHCCGAYYVYFLCALPVEFGPYVKEDEIYRKISRTLLSLESERVLGLKASCILTGYQ